MRTLLTLALLAAAAAAQWALDPSLGYRGWTVDAAPSLPASLSATVQLLPTPYWQEWILGNWTTAFALGRGCVVQGGPLRYGIGVGYGMGYVETPAVKLGQNFTVVAVFKPRYPYAAGNDYGGLYAFYKYGTLWYGEISATYESWPPNGRGTIFRISDASGRERAISTYIGGGYVSLIYVGMYVASQDTYYMYIYSGGTLMTQASYRGQRGDIQTSSFLLGNAPFYAPHQLWYVAFAVYNRSLTAQEVAGWRPEAPPGGDLVMHYYAHPQFVRDVDGDGVLEWLDLSGNGRHAKLRGATPQWFVEPVVLQTQQCGGASLTAQWDGFTASYAVNGTQRSTYEPGRVHFDGLTGYAVVPITVYGWRGITVEQYVYPPPAQRFVQWGMFTHMGERPNIAGIYIPSYVSDHVAVEFTTRVGDPYTGNPRWYTVDFRTGRWQHVVMTYDSSTRMLRYYVNGSLVNIPSPPASTQSSTYRRRPAFTISALSSPQVAGLVPSPRWRIATSASTAAPSLSRRFGRTTPTQTAQSQTGLSSGSAGTASAAVYGTTSLAKVGTPPSMATRIPTRTGSGPSAHISNTATQPRLPW